MATHTRNFINTPHRNPKNTPNPPSTASLTPLCAINSPKSAPKNGPSKIPKGKKNIPASVPIVHPRIPTLEQLNRLAPKEGTIKSRIVTAVTIVPNTINAKEDGGFSENNMQSNPQYATIGPGTTGTKHPTAPSNISSIAIDIHTILMSLSQFARFSMLIKLGMILEQVLGKVPKTHISTLPERPYLLFS